MRRHGDPMADDAARALFTAIKGHPKEEVARFITAFVSQDFSKAWEKGILIEDPPELIAYFEAFDEFKLTPREIDFLEKGAEIFKKHGPWITFALGVRSLLKQYAHTKAIEVLRLTTLLVKHVNRRIMETMQFVMDVMTPGWEVTQPDGTRRLNLKHPGLMSIKKLRLVHAMVRYRLQNKLYDTSLGDYNIDDLGFPINQEDMVFAVHTFSLEVIEGLREMRINISDEEAEIYFECWKIIGRGLGVDRRLEPVSYQDATDLQELIYKRHFTLPNQAGPVLATALINWFVEIIPLAKTPTIITFIKEFNGPENFTILRDHLRIDLGNAHPDLQAHLKEDLQFEEKMAREHMVTASDEKKTIDQFFLIFLTNLLNTERGGKNQTFRIGDGFMAAWNLNEMAEKPPSKLQIVLMAVVDFIKEFWPNIKAFFTGKKKSGGQ